MNRRTLTSIAAVALISASNVVCSHLPGPDGRHDESGHVTPNAESLRTWTNSRTGETYRGSYLASRDGLVTIESDSGKVVFLLNDDLAETDRNFTNRQIAQARALNERVFAQAAAPTSVRTAATISPNAAPANSPPQASIFAPFAPAVRTRWDDRWLYVESDGLPHAPLAHTMMVGIRSWQQQVPLPQSYSGNNAWQIPLRPELADTPISGRTQLYRGAIALAANGIPIFNALNNRGEDALRAGELDEFGGHCGRGDDYHYHVAPLALQAIVGKDKPFAYALDGFPIFGLFDPQAPQTSEKACPLHTTTALDELNGHFAVNADGSRGLYHYHASTTYPYINGGVRGKVTVSGDQIDPQPRGTPIRPAGNPLRGATITEFKETGDKAWTLKYTLGGQVYAWTYRIDPSGTVTFNFYGADGTAQTQSYAPRGNGGPGGGPPRQDGATGGRPPRPSDFDNQRNGPSQQPQQPRSGGVQSNYENEIAFPKSAGFVLSSPAIAADQRLPATFTCDGGGISPPLHWTTPPSGTKSLALIMHHTPGPGDVHVYWVLYNLPPGTTSLPTSASGIGQWGVNTVNRQPEYAPPCSKGPGDKTYTLTLYALSAEPSLAGQSAVTRETLLAAIKDNVLTATSLDVTYARTGDGGSNRPPQSRGNQPPPPPPPRRD